MSGPNFATDGAAGPAPCRALVPAMPASILAARYPARSKSSLIVDIFSTSGNALALLPSTPSKVMSRGTCRPQARAASYASCAKRSFAAKTAVPAGSAAIHGTSLAARTSRASSSPRTTGKTRHALPASAQSALNALARMRDQRRSGAYGTTA